MSGSRIFFSLLVAFILGVVAASFVPFGIAAVSALFIFGIATALFGIMRPGERRRVAVVGFCVAAFALGSLRFLHSARHASLLGLPVGRPVTIVGTVDAEPERRAKSQQFVLREESSGEEILVRTRPFPAYRYGDRLRISGALGEPENFSDDFDYRAYLAKENIFLLAAFPDIQTVARGEGNDLYRLLFWVKEAFSGQLGRWLPEPHASFMAGLILGERRSMPPALVNELKTTGTTHLVALSGYNIPVPLWLDYSSL